MATIHHAVVKSAAAKGVILTLGPDDEAHAHRPEPNRRVTLPVQFEGDAPDNAACTEAARDAWNALDNILAFELDNPGIRIEQEDGDFVGSYTHVDTDALAEIARDPDLDDLFETLREHLASAQDDEDEPTGSVVPAKYKAEYRARGDASHCGDWLALTLAGLCRVTDGKKEVTDLDRLEAIANANDVAPARYGRLGVESNGWQGRFRMTIRNMLTPRVAAKGFLFVPEGCGVDADTEMQAPREWCVAHSSKPKTKLEPQATGSAVQKEPGAGKPSARTKAKQDGEAGLAEAKRALKAAKDKKGA